MAARRSGSTRNETIRCPYCGEDYAASYRHCPFCDELPLEEDYDEEEAPRSRSRSGGKRLMTNTRGGGYGGGPTPGKIIATILSLALIVAAVIIVITQILPLLSKDSKPDPSPSPSSSIQPSESPSADPSPAPTRGRAVNPPPSRRPSPSPTPGSGTAATGFTLDKTEFSISDRYPDPVTIKVTFTPAGTSGKLTWTSSDPEVVSVDANGKVSPGSKQGSATITAALEGGVSRTCLVYNSTTGSGGGAGGGNASTALSLNREDFTLTAGESFQVKVSGTTSTPVWSIGNTAVATVSGNGTVTYAGPGKTTLTCTVDGHTLTCTVRGK